MLSAVYYFLCGREDRVHHFSGGGLGGFDAMGVYFRRGVGVAVAQVTGDGSNGYAVSDLECCICMSEAVDMDLGEVCVFDEITKPTC